jgi:major capsid protein
MQCNLNGNQVSVQSSDLISPFSRIGFGEKEIGDREMSIGPTMTDQYQVYTSGVNRDPLAPYGSDPYVSSRGSWAQASGTAPSGGGGPAALVGRPEGGVYLDPLLNVAGGTTGVAQFTDAFELQLSPFCFGSPDASSFIGLSGADFSFTFNNLNRLWSRNQTLASTPPYSNSITSITVVVNSARLTWLYDVPQSISALPSSVSYPYELANRYSTDIPILFAPGMVQTVVSNTIALPSIPKRLIVFGRRSNSTQDWTTSDTFLVIQSVNVNMLSQSGVLNSADQKSLYLMAVKNGVQLSWPQWSNYVGSICVFDFSTDLALPDPSLAPSVSEQFPLQVTVTFRNSAPVPVQATMFMVVMLEGTATIRDASLFLQTSIVSRRDVLDVRNKPQVDYSVGEGRYGGDFFSSLKGLIPAARSLLESHPVGALASKGLKTAFCDNDGNDMEERPRKSRHSGSSAKSIMARRRRP